MIKAQVSVLSHERMASRIDQMATIDRWKAKRVDRARRRRLPSSPVAALLDATYS